MPGTCEPEGYTAEKRKGHVRALQGGAKTSFRTLLGYVDRQQSTKFAEAIAKQAKVA
jgi:monosaccharide-transporting ATPase